MTELEILSEIKNKLPNYDQQGLLDEITIRNGIRENIKEFGGNIMSEYQTALLIQKGKAKLPSNFWALKAAVKCEQEGYVKETTEKNIQRRISYLEWTDIKDYYNYLEGKPCLESGDSKYITETLFFDTPKEAYTFYYKQPKLLNLVPHTYSVRCDSNCPNLIDKSEFNISIDENHNYLTTNFNDGFVWLWYKGLPCDEEFNLIIPDTSRDKLKNYIIYFAICRVLEDLWLSEDDPNIQNKLQYFSNLKNQYFYEAKSESINKGMLGWKSRIINNNRRESNKYERIFRSLDPNRPYGRGFTNNI